jgi:eukaryotic-like serine/threonine-protein kinase
MGSVRPYRVQPGNVLLNKFEIIRPLGRGHFGEVHHARNLLVGRPAALKIIEVIDPATHRAEIEAQAQYLCAHDHVVKIHGADAFNGFVLIEMEYVEGGSLGDRLKREFVPLADGVKAVKEVLFALEHAHCRGIVHRDVKPANIMLAHVAKLSDFGTIIQPNSGVRVTDLFYQLHAPPEAVNFQEFSARGDVFAAGLTLLRIANNMPEWGTLLDDEASVLQDIQNGRLPERIGFADYMPSKLKRVLRTACSPDPTGRYQSAAAFRQALERLRFVRRWIRVSENEWVADVNRRQETLRYVNGGQPSVEYFVGSRRRHEFCGGFRTERQAREYLHKILAKTTVA